MGIRLPRPPPLLSFSLRQRHLPQHFPTTIVPFGRMASNLSTVFGLKDSSLIKTQGFIDGKWLDAKDGTTISVTNPATGEEIGTVPEMGIKETQEAISSAHRAFATWKKTTAKTIENGKTLTESKGEVAYSSSFLEWFGMYYQEALPKNSSSTLTSSLAEEAVRTYGEHIPTSVPGVRNVTIMQPVVTGSAILTPWNFPSAMITRKLGPALAAGCTAVIKPPPETPFSALALTELARRAGFPDGVINVGFIPLSPFLDSAETNDRCPFESQVVTTAKNVGEVGKELCENVNVRKVTFTGSTAVAKLLYSMSASTMKKISFEAGGNSPFIVFDDADIDAAIEGAIACKFRASGQTCVCANRIYVQSSVYAEFASRLAARVTAFKVGNGLDKESTHGPLIHERAIQKVEGHVSDALSKGAQVLVGGKRIDGPGSFFAPTVLADVPPDVKLTEEEVLRLANDSEFGLAGYFYSRDVGRVWRVAEALEVGMVGTNTGLISQAVIPFGGVKESGIGREGGHGIKEYMQTKLITFGL
ncbi:succinate-semialdehyde dehydrogenase [Phellopilus nigrolimitatus]|nr:succinate-semialdehyde dehydrogenase [Phellopilus nigrolimitatus]